MTIIKAELRNYKPMVSQPYMQIVLSVPAEQALEVQNALGYPTPGESIWVKLERLTEEA
jgi:hypothetical protein